MATPYRQAVFDEDLRRKLSGIFPGQSLASMQPALMSGGSGGAIAMPGGEEFTFSASDVPQEPMPQRVDVGAYLDDQSSIQQNRDKWSSRIRAMGGNISFPSLSDDTMRRAGIQDEMIQAEILNRQRAAILGGEISNIDEQMTWYQRNAFDPHFAKTAREAAQSIFAQRRAQTGEERAVAGEERAVLGEARAVTAAEQAAERFKFAQAEAKRKQQEFNASQTTEDRNELIALRENELLAWAADKWWALKPEERTEAKREEIAREMSVLARDKDFKGFSVIAGRTVPNVGRGITTTPPVTVDLNEKSLIDTFRNEAKVVLKDEEKEDEDFVTVPALTYSDRYEDEWRTAADDFETATKLGSDIRAAIRTDDTIAPENKQAVLEQVLKNLESVEKGVARPAEVAPLTDERRMNELITAVTTLTGDLTADRANRHKAHIRIKRENRIQNPFVRSLTRDEQNDEGFIQIEDFLSIDEETAIDLDIQQSFMDRINAVNEMRKLDDLSAFILEADPSFKIPAGYDVDELKKAILRKIKRDYEDFTVMPRGYSESVIRRNKED